MKNRISLSRNYSFLRVTFISVAVGLGCSGGGCGAGGDSGAKPETASEPVPVGVKSMQDSVKQQARMQKGGADKQRRSVQPGK
jgi:hypothetical protein